MGDHNDGDVLFAGNFFEHLDDRDRTFGIECGGGFVGEDDLWFIGEGTDDGDTLLLSAGELIGHRFFFVCDTEVVEKLPGFGINLLLGNLVVFRQQNDIFNRVEKRDQIGFLEDKSNLLPADTASIVNEPFVIVDELFSQPDFAGSRIGHTTDHHQKRCLAGPTGSDQCDQLPFVYGKRGTLDHIDAGIPLAEVLVHIFHFDTLLCHRLASYRCGWICFDCLVNTNQRGEKRRDQDNDEDHQCIRLLQHDPLGEFRIDQMRKDIA